MTHFNKDLKIAELKLQLAQVSNDVLMLSRHVENLQRELNTLTNNPQMGGYQPNPNSYAPHPSCFNGNYPQPNQNPNSFQPNHHNQNPNDFQPNPNYHNPRPSGFQSNIHDPVHSGQNRPQPQMTDPGFMPRALYQTAYDIGKLDRDGVVLEVKPTALKTESLVKVSVSQNVLMYVYSKNIKMKERLDLSDGKIKVDFSGGQHLHIHDKDIIRTALTLVAMTFDIATVFTDDDIEEVAEKVTVYRQVPKPTKS